MSPYMDIGTLAPLLDLTPHAVGALVLRGRLPAPKSIGADRRWKWSEIESMRPPINTGFVYFAECADLIKIGYSSNVDRRMRALSSANPYPISVLLVLRGTLSFEADLHAKFHALRKRGEWFAKGDDLLAYIKRMGGRA